MRFGPKDGEHRARREEFCRNGARRHEEPPGENRAGDQKALIVAQGELGEVGRDESHEPDRSDEAHGPRDQKGGEEEGLDAKARHGNAEAPCALLPDRKRRHGPGPRQKPEGGDEREARGGRGRKAARALQIPEGPAVDELRRFGTRAVKEQLLQRKEEEVHHDPRENHGLRRHAAPLRERIDEPRDEERKEEGGGRRADPELTEEGHARRDGQCRPETRGGGDAERRGTRKGVSRDVLNFEPRERKRRPHEERRERHRQAKLPQNHGVDAFGRGAGEKRRRGAPRRHVGSARRKVEQNEEDEQRRPCGEQGDPTQGLVPVVEVAAHRDLSVSPPPRRADNRRPRDSLRGGSCGRRSGFPRPDRGPRRRRGRGSSR